jgi:hypothetical protein
MATILDEMIGSTRNKQDLYRTDVAACTFSHILALLPRANAGVLLPDQQHVSEPVADKHVSFVVELSLLVLVLVGICRSGSLGSFVWENSVRFFLIIGVLFVKMQI